MKACNKDLKDVAIVRYYDVFEVFLLVSPTNSVGDEAYSMISTTLVLMSEAENSLCLAGNLLRLLARLALSHGEVFDTIGRHYEEANGDVEFWMKNLMQFHEYSQGIQVFVDEIWTKIHLIVVGVAMIARRFGVFTQVSSDSALLQMMQQLNLGAEGKMTGEMQTIAGLTAGDMAFVEGEREKMLQEPTHWLITSLDDFLSDELTLGELGLNNISSLKPLVEVTTKLELA